MKEALLRRLLELHELFLHPFETIIDQLPHFHSFSRAEL